MGTHLGVAHFVLSPDVVLLTGVLAVDPTYLPACQEWLRLSAESKQIPSIRTLMQRWPLFNPGDKRAENVLMQLERGYNTADTAGLNNP